MKRAIIIVNGDLANLSYVQKKLRKTDLIICVNGGTKHAMQINIIPHVVIGDMDSLSDEIKLRLSQEKIKWIPFAPEKELTDTELALEYAQKKHISEIVICGILGSRMDHLLSNIFLAGKLSNNKLLISIIEGKQQIYFVHKTLLLTTRQNDLISLIPFSTDCMGVSTHGLKYVLSNETLYFGKSRGVSNVAMGKVVQIEVKKGLLMAIHHV